MKEIHICPIKMRTVVIEENNCDAQDETCDDCPVLDMMHRREEYNDKLRED